MIANGFKETRDYTALKWKIEEGVGMKGDAYFKATFYPCEDCYLCYREWKDEADMSVFIGGNHGEYKLPTNIFRKVINEVIAFIETKTNVRIPKIQF